jgi:ornithine carbamoyltransferase
MKDFLRVDDFTKEEIYLILDRANHLQQCWRNNAMPQSLKDKKIALWFFGQGFRNRVAFEIGARSMGADVSFIPDLGSSELIKKMNDKAAGSITVSSDMDKHITKETDVLYTDCWPKTENKETIKQQFIPYQIKKDIVQKMNPKGFYMPCPPITRGEELTEDSLHTTQYCDYQAKEYLLHSQNAIMEYLINQNVV